MLRVSLVSVRNHMSYRMSLTSRYKWPSFLYPSMLLTFIQLIFSDMWSLIVCTICCSFVYWFLTLYLYRSSIIFLDDFCDVCYCSGWLLPMRGCPCLGSWVLSFVLYWTCALCGLLLVFVFAAWLLATYLIYVYSLTVGVGDAWVAGTDMCDSLLSSNMTLYLLIDFDHGVVGACHFLTCVLLSSIAASINRWLSFLMSTPKPPLFQWLEA